MHRHCTNKRTTRWRAKKRDNEELSRRVHTSCSFTQHRGGSVRGTVFCALHGRLHCDNGYSTAWFVSVTFRFPRLDFQSVDSVYDVRQNRFGVGRRGRSAPAIGETSRHRRLIGRRYEAKPTRERERERERKKDRDRARTPR
jgi:hypothetical protein